MGIAATISGFIAVCSKVIGFAETICSVEVVVVTVGGAGDAETGEIMAIVELEVDAWDGATEFVLFSIFSISS